MARHVRAACCAAPGQGLEPRSRRSERRILPIERTRIAVRRRTARGTRTLITVGLSHGPLPIGLERHANSHGREPDGRGRRGYRRLPLPGGWLCPEGGGREVAPSLRIVRAAVPPRGLEPRSPRYEGGVLPVELRWRVVPSP